MADFFSGYAAPRSTEQKLETEGYFDGVLARSAPLDELPEEVDLLADLPPGAFWPVRDQRHRGTCTAFALAACCELLTARDTGAVERLSPEYLYYRTRERAAADLAARPPQYAQGAVRLSQSAGPLADHGICREALMPYDLTDALMSDAVPTGEADADAATRRFEVAAGRDYGLEDAEPEGMANILRGELAAGRPVALALEIFYMERPACHGAPAGPLATTNFTYGGARNSGLIPGPRMQAMGVSPHVHSGHVVCVTGYQPGPEALGGGFFVFRNSWAGAFGRHPGPRTAEWPAIPGPGWGAVSAAYVEAFTIEYLSLRRVAAAE